MGVAPDSKGLAFTTGNKIDVNNKGGKISPLLGNYDNLKNVLVHEKVHLDNGQGFKEVTNLEHAQVYADQIADPTFKATTASLKIGILGSAADYLKDAYNIDNVQRSDVEGVLDNINKSIQGLGYQLVVDPLLNKMTIYLDDKNKKKKNENQ